MRVQDLPSADPTRFREAARRYSAGIVIATASHESRSHAATVTAFCPLSLDPPLVLLALDRDGQLVELARAAGHIGLSLLADNQREIAVWASKHGRTPAVTLSGVTTHSAVTGAPLVVGAVAWFDCVVDSESVHGDHALLVARVVDAGHAPGRPLVYVDRAYHRVGERLGDR